MVDMGGIEQRNQNINVKQSDHVAAKFGPGAGSQLPV